MRRFALLMALTVAGCKTGVSDPCAKVVGTCINLTVTSQHVAAIDTLLISAGDPIASSTSSSLGHSGNLPAHVAITIPATISGSVHFDVTGILNATALGVGFFDATLVAGQHVTASAAIEPADLTGRDGGTDDLAMDMPSTPSVAARLVAPLSTSTVTNHRPHVRWKLPAGTSNPQLDFCTTRACSQTIGSTTIDPNGLSGSPNIDLPTGSVFWRVRATGPGGEVASAAWEFSVQKRAKQIEGVDSSWGTFLDVNGDGRGDIAVGAPLAPVKGVDGVGRVYVFHSNATGFDSTPVILDGPGATNSYFGQQVMSAGDVNGDGYADLLVVDTKKQAVIFHGGPAGIAGNAGPATTLPAFVNNESVAAAGDVNGDGYADLVVGVPQTGMQGQASLLFGGPGGISNTLSWTVNGSDTQMGVASSQFGVAVAGAGDVNGDGYDDVIIGAPDQTHGGTANTGSVYVYFGGASQLTPFPTPPLADLSLGNYGQIVAGANDLDGDGYSDVLIGSASPGGGTVDYAVSVILGGPTTYRSGPKLTNPQIDSLFAASAQTVASAGDIDGDGLADVIIGAPAEFPTSGGASGAIHVFLASTSGGMLTLNEQGPTRYGPDGTNGLFGIVAGAGDVDGDGRADVLVGAPCAPTPSGCTGSGTAYLFKGIATGGLRAVADQKWVGPDPGGHFGTVATRDDRRGRSAVIHARRLL